MNNVLSLLSCCSNRDNKPFSNDDIRWVEALLGLKNGFDEFQLEVLQNLDNLDVEACPGSGKTTVLVAKLALLSRYWIPKEQGICVISLTNAAREEIQERLGETEEGQKLLRPPHFIGTIHSFFSEFLAKPYLNSNSMSIVSIDDDFCRSRRRKTLQKKPYIGLTDHLLKMQVKKRTDVIETCKPHTTKFVEAQQWLVQLKAKSLQEQRLGIPIHWRMIDTKFNVETDYGKSLDLPKNLVSIQKKVVKEVVEEGIFAFSDIFVYSKALMETSPEIYSLVRTRFPLLFIDEAQDTSSSQARLIHELFISQKNESCAETVRQRFGDVNQTIYNFEPPMGVDDVDPYPSKSLSKLTIPVSHRFDESIAKIVSTFATNPPDIAMRGMRDESLGGRKHCILIFTEKTKEDVIPSFAEYAIKELRDQDISESKIRVCSHIHKEKDAASTKDDFARTIRDYYAPYIASNMTKEYQQHNFFIDYLRHARFLVRETKEFKIGIEKIAEGLFKGCIIASENNSISLVRSPFSQIKSYTHKNRAISRVVDSGLFSAYSIKAISILTNETELDESNWKSFLSDVFKLIRVLMSSRDLDLSEEEYFSFRNSDEVYGFTNEKQRLQTEKGNIYRHHFKTGNLGFIDIKLGTIHSVKGQTHTASLMLESTNRGPILGQLKNYILGLEEAKMASGNKKAWLNTLYVGMTRPTHLICLAIPETHKKGSKSLSWSEDDVKKLKAIGWQVARVNEGSKLIFL